MTKLAGPTKTSELEAYELKAETATSRDFVLGNIMLPVGLNHNPLNQPKTLHQINLKQFKCITTHA